VLLAAALVRDPDLLILDEPTNHLDIDAITHLEGALQPRRGTLVFVTHDRSFLRHLATRILDLDRGVIRSYRSGYDAYVEKREEELRVEAEQDRLFDKKLAQEEAWVRRGIKARRTRNEGRVRALESLRAERGARRDEVARVKAQLQDAERSGRIVLRCQDLGFAFDGNPIVRGFTGTILRGDRIGILGPNGCGKTTLIRLLLGTIAPQAGTVTVGTRLEVAHFEQLHDVLDDTKTVFENLAEGRETIPTGEGERHVLGILRDFLFTPEQIQGSVTRLSGGERRRLQLAKVLSRPCNLLVLDEPTNDLDLETLELLEALLMEFEGTLLLVSHDRAFLDNVVTSTLVWEGDGRWCEYVGGYEDWLRQRKAAEPPPAARPARPRSERTTAQARRVGFKEKRELAELPGRIERLEAERQELFALMASPTFYSTRGDEVARTRQRLAEVEAEIQQAYARWLELEALASGGE
jgi:ATP-binding cassette subfamily F protein uup